MDWTVNDRLCNRFLKWRLKCKNILECELAALLPEKQKCKKVIAWSGDFGMDKYVSWSLPKDELSFNTIWDIFEEFCKYQSNEVRACFDLLTTFIQGNCSVDKWYNAVKAQVNLAKYPPKTAKILHHDIFWFFIKDEDFLSKTIIEGSVDLEKFPASRVESSKATARHIRQVAGDLQVAQINLLWHQCTELSLGDIRTHPKNTEKQPSSQFKRNYDPKLAYKNTDRCPRCGDSNHWEGPAQQKGSSVNHATSMVTIPASVTKEARTSKLPSKLGNLRHSNYRQAHCMHRIVPFVTNLKIPVQKIPFVINLIYSAPKQVSRTFLLLLI